MCRVQMGSSTWLITNQHLTSYPIDGKYHPGTTDPYIDGRIFFDFDISLEDNGMSGFEQLYVDVWNNGNWYNITMLDNADGSFAWDSHHFEITEYAFGEIFKVRFSAEGINSTGIISWFVDNINIYRACDAPTDLVADATGLPDDEILLTWSAPAGSGVVGEWIHWDSGLNEGNAIGFGGAAVWSVASKFDAASLAGFDGMFITKIRFFAGASTGTATFTLKVWEGADGLTMIYEEPVTSFVIGDWNEVVLATPVAIDITQDLYFGYTTEQFDAAEYPAGCDAGPAVAGYGDLINDTGTEWWSMSVAYPTLDYNWNLQAFVGEVTDGAPSIPLVDNADYSAPDNAPMLTSSGITRDVNLTDNSSRALTGYNVYFDNATGVFEFLEFTMDTTYLHMNEDGFTTGELYCYYVTAVWADCEPESNTACWLATGIEDPAIADGIAVFPNPARDILNITSTTDITHVTIMNYVGQVVYNQKVVEDNDLQLNVAGYETGVYMVKVETTAGILIKKVTVAH